MTVNQISTKFVIRNLQNNDIPELVSLPRIEGREMGQETEILTWLNVDPYGIFVAETIEDGQIAGCCCGIALSDTHGYIGMYVVKSNYRGLGLGRILWNAAINHLGDRNVSLSSAPAMMGFYREKGGFSFTAKWTVDLYIGTNPILPSNALSRPLPFTVLVYPNGPFIQHVIDYDHSVHKYDRSVIVKQTIEEKGTLTVMALNASIDDNLQTTGYACMKKGLQGRWLIAPVYAEDYSSARSLLHGLMSALSDDQRKEGVVAKLVSSNIEAAKLFNELGMKKTSYQLQRLFTKEVFEIPENKIFALQSSVFCTE
ncbi:n-acetyltransferase domain-containing protein [Caerostris extrusa]|uniref:N-acetyltransferase domain-containing protein n=1 Tax=Caerostris extrusa TaxID=172846 RepID=A0AAV4UF97_CAEEX|nr:n-acetyltransferase domain-containing protein [Caerostris extrusa]